MPPQPSESSSSQATVLVVDDDPGIRRVVTRVLEPEGFRVIQAESGEEALDLYARFHRRIDVVVLDLVMPGLSGEEVFRELRTWNSDVTVLVSSGHPDNPAHVRLGSYPGTLFLPKPYQPAELVHAVELLLANMIRALEPGRRA